MYTESRMKVPEVRDFRVRKEIILLLGSDTEEVSVVRRTLEAVGYPVLAADNSEETGELFKSFSGAIRLLIIEIAAVGGNLLELIASLRKNNPDLRVIVLSEEVSPRERNDIYISGVIELIRKPADKEQLLQVVRRIV